MSLELEHLAPYLPYKLKGLSPRGTVFYMGLSSNMRGEGIEDREVGTFLREGFKPILRPLSDLTKEIEVDDEKFIPVNKILEIFGKSLKHLSTEYQVKALISFEKDIIRKELPYKYIQKLVEWHFDVFSLISKELAININTLK